MAEKLGMLMQRIEPVIIIASDNNSKVRMSCPSLDTLERYAGKLFPVIQVQFSTLFTCRSISISIFETTTASTSSSIGTGAAVLP
jgi:hypothetical protein